MSSDWREYSLDDLILRRNQGVNTTTEKVQYSEEGVPVIRANNIGQGVIDFTDITFVDEETFERIKEPCKPKKGDVLYTNIGSQFGNAAKVEVDCDFAIAWNVLRIQPSERLNADFLVYLLHNPSNKAYIRSLNSSSTMPFVSGKEIGKTVFTIPDLFTQRGIAQNLKSIDDKIQLNRQTNQTLEQIAQAIFKSWFVNFEPVKAKIQAKQNGQAPERAAMCAISWKTDEELDQIPTEQLEQLATTAALFPDAFEESELGEIPKGWKCSAIGEEVEVVGGGTPSTKIPEFWENGTYNWTTPKDLSGNPDKVLLGTERKLTEAGLSRISSGLLPVDTVLLSSRAPVGYLALAKVPVAINQGYIAMKCHKSLPPVYVLQWAYAVMDDIKQRASGTTFAEISKKNFRGIPVLVPDPMILKKFQDTAEVAYAKISGAISESKYLSEVRDTLLPKLLSGEIELSGVVDE